MRLGHIRIETSSREVSGNPCRVAAFASHDGKLKAVSLIGESQRLKAYRAVLCGGAGEATFTIRWTSADGESENSLTLARDTAAYAVTTDRSLHYGHAAMAFTSTDPQFMVSGSDNELYRRLWPPSQAYDVPLDDDPENSVAWLTYIREQLEGASLMVLCEGLNLSSAMLTASNEELEGVVTRGLKSGAIHISGGMRLGR